MAKSIKPVQAVRRTMVKKVNVYAPIPIRTVTPTIYGKLEGVSMSPATILKCLIGRATVHEILSDGSLLKLTDKNYNTENRPAVNKVAKQGKIDKPKSAIAPDDTRVKKILLDDAIKLNGLGTIKTDEKVISEYVNPKNFLADFENVGIWEDVNWVARIHYLCRKSIFESFGEEKALAVLGPSVPDDDYKQIKVYEIWDKVSKRVLWVCQNNANLFLKEIENPLGVEGFFPCPKPIFATLANGSIIPVPDYAMIKADIEELGGVVDRMSLTMKALKVTGAYDSSFPHLADILNKDVSLVAVQDFDKLKNAGGIKGIVDFMPIEQYISALQALAARRDDIIENIYRVTGISDIMRGTSNPDDTATAVKQKTNFGTLRNQDRQNDMQRFICDLYRLKAEIICEQFSTDNLASFLTAEERQNQALVQAAIRLLKTDKMRDMVLSVETDAVFNQAAEEAKVVSTVETVHKLIQGAFQLVSLQPKLLPMYQKMIAAVVASMPNARGFESVVENCFAQIKSELEVETPSLSAQDVKVSQSLPEAAYQSQQLSVDDQLKMMQIQNNYEIEKEKNALKAREVALKENAEAAKISLSNKELNLQAQEQKLKADEKAKL